MNYRCLGNNQYEIALTIFRDCDTGVPWFDSPASIGIFNSSNQYVSDFAVYPRNNDTLPIALPDSCLSVSTTACIHTTTYLDTISLSFLAGGYTLAYQRCCRNQDIVNITTPTATGATYFIRISEQALLTCNNSPRFKELPPVYLCAGVPINYDYSATDADGDSLVYEMCTPTNGANQGNPAPQPPNSPPYADISWLNPYTVNNQLGGPNPLTIDPQTGLLTGTPQTLGIFLVGICIKEYRNGVLLSTTRRDFQHIVGSCTRIAIADFSIDSFPCRRSLKYDFINTGSIVAGSGGTFLWQFDTLGTATTFSPSFTFPDTGTYTINLFAGIGSPCVDTHTIVMDANIEDIELTAAAPALPCQGDTIWLSVNDVYGEYSDSTTYTWLPDSMILDGQGTDSILVLASNSAQFSVTGINNYGCSDLATTNLNVRTVTAAFDSTVTACNTSLTVQFNNNSTSSPPSSSFQWTFGNSGTATATNPTFTFPDTGTYQVSLIAGTNTPCPDTIMADVNLPLQGVVLNNLNNQSVCLGDSVWITVDNLLEDYADSTTFTWIPNTSILAGQGTDSVLVLVDNTVQLRVGAINNFGCADSTLATLSPIEVVAALDTISLSCNTSLTVPFVNNSYSNVPPIDYLWIFDNLDTSTLSNPTYSFPDTGNYTIQMVAGPNSLCPDTVAINVNLPLEGVSIDANDTVVICQGDTAMLIAANALADYTDFTTFNWSPSTNIISGQGNDTALVWVDSTRIFTVTALNSHGCRDTTTATGSITYVAPTVSVSSAPDSLFVGQETQLFATEDSSYTYIWNADTTLSSYFIPDPTAKPRQQTTYYLNVENQFGCFAFDSITVYIKEPLCGDPLVFLPNAFTPNGDGHNDVLMVNGNNITELRLVIYNRWGQKIFETTDQSIGWDGTFQGKALPPDVYGYYLECICEEGDTLFQKGNISLIK